MKISNILKFLFPEYQIFAAAMKYGFMTSREQPVNVNQPNSSNQRQGTSPANSIPNPISTNNNSYNTGIPYSSSTQNNSIRQNHQQENQIDRTEQNLRFDRVAANLSDPNYWSKIVV